jgi:hypothetical protein
MRQHRIVFASLVGHILQRALRKQEMRKAKVAQPCDGEAV